MVVVILMRFDGGTHCLGSFPAQHPYLVKLAHGAIETLQAHQVRFVLPFSETFPGFLPGMGGELLRLFA